MTPDPSLAPVAVWVTGLAGAGLDYARLAIYAVMVGLAIVALLGAGTFVVAGLRR